MPGESSETAIFWSMIGWMVAGPLFDSKAEEESVTAVYLPHFVDLQGNQRQDREEEGVYEQPQKAYRVAGVEERLMASSARQRRSQK